MKGHNHMGTHDTAQGTPDALVTLREDLSFVGDYAWRYADNSDAPQLVEKLEAAENRIEAALEAQAAELAALRDWRERARAVLQFTETMARYEAMTHSDDCPALDGLPCDCIKPTAEAMAKAARALLAEEGPDGESTP